MSSGIAVDEQCLTSYYSMKSKKANKYVIFSLSLRGLPKWVVEKEGVSADLEDKTNEEILDELKGFLPHTEARFAVFDCPIIGKTGDETNKLIFIRWQSANAPFKSLRLYWSSEDALKKKLIGVEHIFQAMYKNELTLTAVAKQAGSCAWNCVVYALQWQNDDIVAITLSGEEALRLQGLDRRCNFRDLKGKLSEAPGKVKGKICIFRDSEVVDDSETINELQGVLASSF